MAGLLLEHTDKTLSTLLVVHKSFSYVKDRMILTKNSGPPLAKMINCVKEIILLNTVVQFQLKEMFFRFYY